jgi:hypothetical protein
MNQKMSPLTNALNWFEIPAADINRAQKFYESIFDIQMQPMKMMDMKMAMFPWSAEHGKVGGALVQSSMHKPGATGSILYLNANPDLQHTLNAVQKANGKILMPKTLIDENSGYMALINDTEGNTIGLHSNG